MSTFKYVIRHTLAAFLASISATTPATDANAQTQSLESVSCGTCHPDKLSAWRASLHALAFSDGVAGQLQLFSHDEQRDCLRCHAPRNEQQADWFARGHAARIEGVDCAACHVRDGTRVGSRAVAVTPHGEVREEPLFRRSEFCAPCHQFGAEGLSLNGKPLENTLEEWRTSRHARTGVTCQQCHLPGARHEFKGIHDPKMTRMGLTVTVTRSARTVRLVAANTGAGHALPTYTTPLIRLLLKGPQSKSERSIGRILAWNPGDGLREVSDTRLLPDQSLTMDLPLEPGDVAEARVTVDPDHDYHNRIYPDLLRGSSGGRDNQGVRLLQSAMETARGRKYVLYRFRCASWKGGAREDCESLP